MRKILKDIRLAKKATQRSSRPEDIVNSNIQVRLFQKNYYVLRVELFVVNVVT